MSHIGLCKQITENICILNHMLPIRIR